MIIDHPGVSIEDRINLYKLVIARSDITEALFSTQRFIRDIRSMKDDGFLYLQNSIVVAYGRPFKRSRPYGALGREWPGFKDGSLSNAHELLIEHRDTIVAHSDSKHRKVRILPKGVKTMPDYPPTADIGVEISATRIALEYFPVIEASCRDLGHRLNARIDDEVERMYGGMNLPPSSFDLLDTED